MVQGATFQTPQFSSACVRTCDLTKKGVLLAPLMSGSFFFFDTEGLFFAALQFCGMYALLFAKIHSFKLLLQCFCCLDACRKLESALPGEPKKATRSRAVSVTEAIPGLVPNQASEEVCRYLQP